MVLSVCIVAIQDAVIILTTFIIGRVGSSTKDTFSWSISWFDAIAGIVARCILRRHRACCNISAYAHIAGI